jgi:hypothetical protein
VYDYVQKVLGDNAIRPDIQPLLPQPKQITYTEGTCQVAKAEIITHIQSPIANNPSPIAKEGYTMTITPTTITIEASDEAGIFYAKQTLKQWGDQVPCGRVQTIPTSTTAVSCSTWCVTTTLWTLFIVSWT